MRTRRILITGAGGGGSNNLIADLRRSSLAVNLYQLVGSNIQAEILAKSPLEENYILPVATDPRYERAIRELVEQRRIDLVVPNNDREVAAISTLRGSLPCRLFLPSAETVRLCQDKKAFYDRLRAAGVGVAETWALRGLQDVEPAMERIGDSRFWIRPRSGSGSQGATWVRSPEQGKAWISLWIQLRGYSADQFTVSEFLPGRDLAVHTMWKDGELQLLKMCERLEYFAGSNRLSGMSSTPAVAKTVRDDAAIELVMRAARAICEEPHGNFNFDLKGRSTGEWCVTECNIGRFFMITSIFDRTGKHNSAELYVRLAFGETVDIEDPIDVEEGKFLLRDLDMEPTIIDESGLDALRGSDYPTIAGK